MSGMPTIVSPPSMAPLAKLRARTMDLHQQLDRHSRLSRLGCADCALDEYVGIMQAMWAAYVGVDACLAGSAPLNPPALPHYQPRAPLLWEDLLRLGGTKIASPANALPLPISESQYLGMRYVVEGALLGARMIHRALMESPLSRQIPIEESFWVRVQQAPSSWPVFLKHLETIPTIEQSEEAAQSACVVFGHFIDHLKSSGGLRHE